MSLLSALKKVVSKVNDHTEDLQGIDTDINELFDRMIELEGGAEAEQDEKEEEGSPSSGSAGESSSEDEEGLKLEE